DLSAQQAMVRWRDHAGDGPAVGQSGLAGAPAGGAGVSALLPPLSPGQPDRRPARDTFDTPTAEAVGFSGTAARQPLLDRAIPVCPTVQSAQEANKRNPSFRMFRAALTSRS